MASLEQDNTDGTSEHLTLEWRLNVKKAPVLTSPKRKAFPVDVHSKCKGPVVEMSLVCFRNRKTASVSGALLPCRRNWFSKNGRAPSKALISGQHITRATTSMSLECLFLLECLECSFSLAWPCLSSAMRLIFHHVLPNLNNPQGSNLAECSKSLKDVRAL